MKATNLVPIFALTLTIFISTPHPASAGGPSPTNTTATLKGTVRFEGKLPPPKPINMAADPSCAKQHPSPMLAQPVMTDSKGGLQDVVVFIAEGLGDRTFEVPTQPAVVEQKGCMYLPHVLAVRANQPLHLVNDDPTSHNIHPTPANNREWNKAEPPGSSVDEAFARGRGRHSGKVQRASLDARLHRRVQAPFFRSDRQRWQFRLERSATRHLYHQSVA